MPTPTTSTDAAIHAELHRRQLALMGRLYPGHPEALRQVEEGIHPGYRFPWRIAEAPAIVPEALHQRDVAAMRRIVEFYFNPEFRRDYQDRVPEVWRRPDDGGWFPKFVATDFQRVYDSEEQRFSWCCPEIQSFPGNVLLKPTLLSHLVSRVEPGHGGSPFLNPELSSWSTYLGFLARHVLEGVAAADTIILEVQPSSQKTLVDMLLWAKHLGVRIVALEDVELSPSNEILYRRAIAWNGDRPQTLALDRPARAQRVLSRCLPLEVEAAIDAGTVSQEVVRGIFQEALETGTATFAVHPQDFYVLSKAALVGNPKHHPPLRPLTRELLNDLDRQGMPLSQGILKPTDSAGGQGLRGWTKPISRAEIEALLAGSAGERCAFVWQERYQADLFDRRAIPGFVPAAAEEGDAVYHELRLLWAAAPRPRGAPHEVDLTLLTGMTRWSRSGFPSNAGFQSTPFTGTHGLLVER